VFQNLDTDDDIEGSIRKRECAGVINALRLQPKPSRFCDCLR
jgi:hypothetical protein